MYEEKPTAAYALSLVGGIFIILGGVFVMLLGGSFIYFGGFGPIFLAMGVIGLVLGIVIILGAVTAYGDPKQRSTWGVVILVLAIVSLVLNAGGFIIGFVLSLIGGILFMTWKPTYAYVGPKMCVGCHRIIPDNYGICPYCGTVAAPPRAPPYYYPQQPGVPQQQMAQPQPYPQQYQAPPPVAPAPVAPPQPAPPQPTPPPAAPSCPNCEEALPSGVRFCPKCGQQVAQ